MRSFEDLKQIYDKIFNNLNGYGVSLLEKRQKINQKYEKDLIYGETPFELLYALFCLEPTKSYLLNAKNFYDLGCGIGNTVIGSYLIGNFEKCVGIELLDSLYKISINAKENLAKIDDKSRNKIDFFHDNLLNINLSDAETILFCCPNTNEDILLEIENKLKKELKKNTLIMSLIYSFKDTNFFSLIDRRSVKSGWGNTLMNTYLAT